MPGPITASKKSSEFDPRSIGSCQLWLDASDLSAVTVSSPVSAWRDKSQNVSSTTSVTGSPVLTTSAINGLRAILLNGSASLTGSTTGSGTTLTVCIVGTQSNTCAVSGGLVCLGRSGFADNTDAGSLAITNSTPLGSGLMVSTRTSVNSQIVNTGGTGLVNGSAATPFVYILVNDGTYVNSYLNGTQQSTTNISRTGTFAYTNYVIGSRAGSTAATYWTGYIGEVLVYNSSLTTSQRQGVEGYLAWKWGIQTISARNLVAGHSFYYLRPQTRIFQPSDILTPLFWWDAADTKTITGTSSVTAWLNKGSWSGSATSYSGTVVSGSTKYNGLNVVVFPTNGELRFTAAIPLQPRAWFAVFNQTSQLTVVGSPGYTQYFAIINQTQGSGQDAAAGPLIPTIIGTDSYVLSEGPSANPNGVQTGNLVPNGYNVLKQYGWVNSAVSTASNFQTVNGKDYLTAGTPSANFTATAYRTDSVTYSINTATYGNSCHCAEIIMFNTEISISQRQQIEGYLAWKWGLSSLLVSGHPYIKFPPSSVIPFLPTNFSSCVLWLDGADPAGTGILPSAGVQSSWTDKSANVWTATQATGGRQPSFVLNSLNGLPGFSFTNASNQSFATAAQTSLNSITGLSIFAVLLPTWASGAAVSNPSFFGMRIYNGGVSKINYYVHNNYSETDIYNGASTVYHTSAATTTAIGQNKSFIYSGTNNNVTDSTYLNGSLTADSASITFGSGTSLPIVIGGDNTDGECWQGYIYEVILYTRVLSTQERQKVEGYLSWKWSLVSLLPSTHPYKLYEPVQEGFLIVAAPGTPTTLVASNTTSTFNMSWTTGSGGTPVTFTVTVYAGGVLVTASGGTQTISYPTTSTTFSPMTSGVGYTFYVSATNTGGTSAIAGPSSPSVTYTAPSSTVVTTTGAGSAAFGAGTQIIIECWGAGGGSMGQDNTLGAGAGGAYAKTTIAQTAAFTLYWSIGVGGTGSSASGSAGGQTWATINTNAAPTTSATGAKAAGGNGSGVASPNNSTQAANSVGQTIYIGGAGGSGGVENGGGGAASSGGNGSNGLAGNGYAGGAAGTGGGAGGAAGNTGNAGGDGISNVLGGGGGGGSYNYQGGMGGLPGGAGGMGYGISGTAPAGSTNTNTAHGYGGNGGRGQVKYTRT